MKNKLMILILYLVSSVYINATFDPRTTRDIIIDIDTTVTACICPLENDFQGTFTTLATIIQQLEAADCAPILIGQAQVGSTGFTITNSGVYKVFQNITFNPIASSAAITINADNVLLDLQCFSITQGNVTANVDGISISANHKNIIINNGRISNFTRNGISVASGCNNLAYSDITINNCFKGISGSGTVGSPITVQRLVGLDLLSNNTGVSFAFATRASLSDCSFIGNIHAGIELMSSFSNSIDSCTIENTNAATGSAFGISMINGGNNRVQECYIDGVSTNDTFSGNSAVGILIGATENDDMIIGNQISNCTTTSNAQPFGIEMLYTLTAINQVNQILYSSPDLGLSLNAVEWSPNGRYLAIGDQTNVSIYEYANGNLKQTQVTTGFILGLAWSPDGSYLAVVSSGFFNIYSFDQGLLTLVTSRAGNTFAVSWSPDGKYLAIGNNTDFLTVYAFSNNALTQFAQINTIDRIVYLEWSPDGSYIVVNLETTFAVQIFKFSGNSLQFVTSTAASITGPSSWSPDGKFLAVTTNTSTVNVFSFSGTALFLVATISAAQMGSANPQAVFWSPDGHYLAVITGTTPFALIILRFEGTSLTVQIKQVFGSGSGEFYQGFSWSPLGSFMAFGTGGTKNPSLRVYSGFQFPSGSLIQNNELSNVRGPALPAGQPGVSSGRGLSASSASNLILQNTGFNNDINYVFVNNFFEQFISNAAQEPSLLSNVSFPPL